MARRSQAGRRTRPKKVLTASGLRADVYRVLDEVLETGGAVEIERRGRRIRIVPVTPGKKLDRLAPRAVIVGDPEELIHLDWSHEWRP
jgi:hypothetical protein